MDSKVTIATIKEVQNLFDPKPSTTKASNMINLVRDALNKPKPQIVTILEVRSYFGI